MREQLTPEFVQQHLAVLAGVEVAIDESSALLGLIHSARQSMAVLEALGLEETWSAVLFEPAYSQATDVPTT